MKRFVLLSLAAGALIVSLSASSGQAAVLSAGHRSASSPHASTIVTQVHRRWRHHRCWWRHHRRHCRYWW
jgi:hypothetical protein